MVLGIFPSFAMGMLDIRCSGHLFFSFKQACCVLAVLGILSFHSNGRVAFWLFWASFPFMKLGMLHLGISGHFSSHANGHVAYWLFWPCCPFIEVKHLVAAQLAILPGPRGF